MGGQHAFGENQALLVRRDALLVLDLGLHVVDGVGRFDLERDGFAGEGLDENLRTPTKAKDEVESRFLLNVVIGESAAVFELLSGENQALLVGRDALLVLDLGLDVVNGVRRFYLEGDRLSGQGLDENLHTSAKAKDEVKGRFLLDVVIRESSTIFKLLAKMRRCWSGGMLETMISVWHSSEGEDNVTLPCLGSWP